MKTNQSGNGTPEAVMSEQREHWSADKWSASGGRGAHSHVPPVFPGEGKEMKSEPFDGRMDRDDSDCAELADVEADLEAMFAFFARLTQKLEHVTCESKRTRATEFQPYRQDQRSDKSYCFVGERYDEKKVLAEW